MPRKMIGIFVATTVGFLLLATVSAFFAYKYLPAPNVSANIAVAPTQTVRVYFGNTNLNPAADCQKVFPVVREIAKTPAIGRATLFELLAGPLFEEMNGGYFSAINGGVKLNSLTIKNGVAYADFDGRIEKNLGGSCRVAMIREQIAKTLMQFPAVRQVEVSVDGRSADVLQP
jgi:spore germination protein GerM